MPVNAGTIKEVSLVHPHAPLLHILVRWWLRKRRWSIPALTVGGGDAFGGAPESSGLTKTCRNLSSFRATSLGVQVAVFSALRDGKAAAWRVFGMPRSQQWDIREASGAKASAIVAATRASVDANRKSL